ncbi:MAG TPA: hydrogenase [Verrucomicrobia bacterium]|nr:MAG: hypothetical protein A2X46_13515 [Lentisphaerae bacterium GWF2_57_35]HBA86203.1 hydrogenase [Verrucomicrobiota bacterium]
MTGLWLIVVAAAVLAFSGLPACFFSRRSCAAQRLSAALMILGSAIGGYGVFLSLSAPQNEAVSLPWTLPWGRFSIGLDALSAVFLIPILLVPMLGAIYGLGYWRQADHPDNGRGLGLFYGLLAGAMLMVVVARDSVLLLMAWEVMAVSAFFLATTENENAAVRRAGWIYLVATHSGTLCLFALFVLLKKITGSFALSAVETGALSPTLTTILFLLTLIGFGFKAGVMPLHVWLPGAHANAPSHVSAVMSGVMLKMGIYGIVRLIALLPPLETWHGGLLLALGAGAGILGIAFAIGQSDIKRLLAYSSIENIGIIVMGIGLASLGRTLHRADFVVLGLGGALLHLWNHSLFKSLLFLNSGVVIHATHTREMNRMGGLARHMPVTSTLFLLGAVAICALPPFNGFVSEWLMYLGFFGSLQVSASGGAAWPTAALGAIALAAIGALALACFVNALSTTFLGVSRQPLAHEPHDPDLSQLGPMLLLAAGCTIVGCAPQYVMPLIQQAASQWLDADAASAASLLSYVPLRWIGGIALVLLGAAGIGFLLLRLRLRTRSVCGVGTWSCGYARPTSRMQYTSTSFGQMIVALFAWALWPQTKAPKIQAPLPSAGFFSTTVPDTLLDHFVLPFFRWTGRLLPRLRLLQQGRVQIYLLYIVVMVLLLLIWETIGNKS